jgi:hypothetical protein
MNAQWALNSMLNKILTYLWIHHPRLGQPDTMLTIAVVSTFTVLIKFLVAGVTLKYGDKSITVGAIDAATTGVILAATLGAYVTRKYHSPPDGGSSDNKN